MEKNTNSCSVTCAVKGTNAVDEVLDPVVTSYINTGMFSQRSRMPCTLFRDVFGKDSVLPNERMGKDSLNLKEEEKTKEKGRRSLANTCDVLGGPKTCTYPKENQDSWGGVSFKISQVNGKCTTADPNDATKCNQLIGSQRCETNNAGVETCAEVTSGNPISSIVTHAPVFGGKESSCDSSSETSNTLYKSGVVLTGIPLPGDMQYKVYSFANEAERQLALADDRNDGLKYAKAMKGENGCDVEIVYEFFPKTGGGLMVEISNSVIAVTDAMKWAITDTTTAYTIPSEKIAVFEVGKKEIRENQFLPIREGCDTGTQAVFKFSTQFICKSTGKRVDITSIEMSRTGAPNVGGADEGGKLMSAISTDKKTPTTFQIDPTNPNDCYHKESCGGMSFDPDIILRIDKDNAPESCGSFYWDPLMLAVDGDGQSASAWDKEDLGESAGPTISTVGGFLTTIVVGLFFSMVW